MSRAIILPKTTTRILVATLGVGLLLCGVLPVTYGAEADSATSSDTAEKSADKGARSGGSTSGEDDVTAYINKYIAAGWKSRKLTPSKPATDGEWCRRVFLDVIGRTPTPEEVVSFTSDRDKNKKAKLVDKLLDSDQYIESYARNWTTIWTNILIGRTGGTQQNTLISREGMQQYLRRSFQNNKSFDKMAFELISASGVNTPGEEGYNGAVNFLLDNLNENATPATAKVAQIFLGLQVQCTQCHNHPFNDWKQDQFWSMNAFFRQARALRTNEGRQLVSVNLIDQDFAGEGGNPQEADVFYELRNGILKVAYPVFVDGTKIDPSGYVDQVNRRTKLAELVQNSPYLGKSAVNRIWAHYLGYGFTKPVDDMGPHNKASHDELLEKLGQDFAVRGYDFKQLTRWITLSDAYGLSSRILPKRNDKDDPTLGEQPMFSHFYLRQMSAEQLYESLVTSTQADQTRGSYEDQEKTKSMWLAQFSTAFGTDDNTEGTTFNGSIPQVLMMMNGELVNKATECTPGSFLHSVVTSNKKDADKLAMLYLAAFARKPSKEDMKLAGYAVQAHKGDTTEAMKDIWWTLLNTNEFIINH
ncbi:MAG: DUF1549 domain-containing protein [Pirellulales bacterium]